MSIVDPSLVAVFRVEAEEIVGGLVANLEEAEGSSGVERAAALRSVQRALHNLKGGARLCGVYSCEMISHLLEEELERAGADAPLAVLRRVRRGAWLVLTLLDEDPDAESQLAEFLAEKSADPAPSDKTSEVTSEVTGEQASERSDNAPSSAPAAATPVVAPGAEGGRAAGPAASPAGSSLVRVQAARLDRVLRLATELPGDVVGRQDVARRLEDLIADMERGRRALPASLRPIVEEWSRALEPLAEETRRLAGGRAADDIGDAVKRLRMQRLDEERVSWRRTVDDTAAAVRRDVRFLCEVGDVELDREVQEALRDPLLHLLRNAVDHGIEDAATRVAAGKPATGFVRVSAVARGMAVVLHVDDDGRGLDLDAIRARAIERGLLDVSDAAAASPERLAELAFEPGFSTASNVSRISGRGVGMDVVRTRVRALGGHAIVEDRQPGTRVTLTLPASVVSTRALLVRAGAAVGALPVQHVYRVRRAPLAEIIAVDGNAALPRSEGQPLRLRWLAPLLGADRGVDADEVIVVEVGIDTGGDGRTEGHGPNVADVGIVVEETLGERHFVTRPLPWNLGAVEGISGAAILPDGSIAPQLDVGHIVSLSTGNDARRAAEVARVAPESARIRVLVVDDSFTSRTLQKNILTAAGYEVELAVDGEEAWARLQESLPALVLSDVEMPRLTGLELLKRIRKTERTKILPVIFVTSLERPEEIAAGSEAGADEYIVKGRFDQHQLLAAVERLCSGRR